MLQTYVYQTILQSLELQVHFCYSALRYYWNFHKSLFLKGCILYHKILQLMYLLLLFTLTVSLFPCLLNFLKFLVLYIYESFHNHSSKHFAFPVINFHIYSLVNWENINIQMLLDLRWGYLLINQAIISWKYCKLKMHLMYLSYWTS